MNKLAVLVLFSLMAVRACAVDGISIEHGQGNEVRMSRVGMLWNRNRSWLNDGDWHITGYWEASLGRWRGNKPAGDNQVIDEIGVTPVFRLEQKEVSGMAPYLEGGFLGLHLISTTSAYADRKFGSAFQFGHHLGFGLRLGGHREFDLGYRFQHLSNGGIKEPNQGVNFSLIHFIYHF